MTLVNHLIPVCLGDSCSKIAPSLNVVVLSGTWTRLIYSVYSGITENKTEVSMLPTTKLTPATAKPCSSQKDGVASAFHCAASSSSPAIIGSNSLLSLATASVTALTRASLASSVSVAISS